MNLPRRRLGGRGADRRMDLACYRLLWRQVRSRQAVVPRGDDRGAPMRRCPRGGPALLVSIALVLTAVGVPADVAADTGPPPTGHRPDLPDLTGASCPDRDRQAGPDTTLRRAM